jgi:hypothetical protein
MATPLRATIETLANEFALRVLEAIREAPLDELVSSEERRPPQPSGKKRVRRSPAQIQEAADRIVAIVKRHPKGIRAEDLKRAMGVAAGNRGAKVFTKPLSLALAAKRITMRGRRRATTYHPR